MNTKLKRIKSSQALEILKEMYFDARVVRHGRFRGTKEVSWITLDGVCYFQRYTRETTWEKIIEQQEALSPVWSQELLFEIGDTIEFDWNGRTRALVVEINSHIKHYQLESPLFKKGWYGHRLTLGNYDLKFKRNAIKRC